MAGISFGCGKLPLVAAAFDRELGKLAVFPVSNFLMTHFGLGSENLFKKQMWLEREKLT